MSNRFSRNRSRAQPTPHVCKSKHVTPLSPPPFDPLRMQFMAAITDTTYDPPFTCFGTIVLDYNLPPVLSWFGELNPATEAALGIAVTPGGLDHLAFDGDSLLFPGGLSHYYADFNGWIFGEPYDSGETTCYEGRFDTPCGIVRVVI